MTIRAVLFDLDGTLADTAPDLAAALNRLLAERGRDAVPIERARPLTSSGARGMLRAGFGIDPQDADYETLKARFLELYAANVCGETRLFDGIGDLLGALERRSLPWGVVTNKAERFTFPLLEALELAARTGCVVGGDTTGQAKPHPEPLLHAARVLGIPPADASTSGTTCGTSRPRARRACGRWRPPTGISARRAIRAAWGADAVIAHPREVLIYLDAPL